MADTFPPVRHATLLGFSIMHKEWPNVVRLGVHAPNQQRATYDDNANLRDVVQQNRNTTLSQAAWMEFNKKTVAHHLIHPDMPRPQSLSTTYSDFPTIASFNKGRKEWRLRTRQTSTVGRM
jgi:hypothetical protein